MVIMFDLIDAMLKKIQEKRPLSHELMKTLSQKFREDWTYHSNAIEGNTFTLQETAFFLREGLTIKGKTLREHLEVVNHAEAIEYLHDAIRQRDLTEGLIKEFHAILFQGVRTWAGSQPIVPGAYKTQDNHVLTPSGEIHHYVSAVQVPSEMEKLLDWYKQSQTALHPIELAAIFHHRIASIHPFPDGNGRVSRICMNFILMKVGFPPAIIRKENRLDYYLALEEADKGNPQSFIQLVADEVKRSLEIMIKVL
jgi:Fic family protein